MMTIIAQNPKRLNKHFFIESDMPSSSSTCTNATERTTRRGRRIITPARYACTLGHHTTSSENHDSVHDFIHCLEDNLLDTHGTVMTQCHRANNIDRFRDHLRKAISVSPIETKSKFVPT